MRHASRGIVSVLAMPHLGHVMTHCSIIVIGLLNRAPSRRRS
jgi:hypothetical protein